MDITKVLAAFVMLIGSIITYVVVPYIKAKTAAADLAKSEIERDAAVQKRQELKNWISAAVRAAEMMFHEAGSGSEKLDFVMNYVESLASSSGYTFNAQEIRVMIESEVLELKNQILA